jgi:hypothetical protein
VTSFFPSQLTTGELYASAMSMALRPGGRVLTPEVALKENPAAYEMLHLDPVFRHAMDYTSRHAVGHAYKLVPASSSQEDKMLCGIYVEIMREIENLLNARIAMAKHLMIMGEYYGTTIGERKALNFSGLGTQDYWIPRQIRHISRNRFRKINREDGGIELHLYRPKTREWKPLDKEQARCISTARNSDEEQTFTNGMGLIDPLYVCYVFKKKAEGELINLLERFGQGIPVLGIDENAEGGDTRSLATLNAEYQVLLAEFKARHSFVKRSKDSFEVLDPSATGYQIIQHSIDMYNTQALMLLLGSTLSVTQASHGNYAQSFTHAESANNHLRPTRVGIEELFTFQIFRNQIQYYNRAQFAAIGLGSARPPRLEIPEDRRDDFEKNAKILQAVQGMGGAIKEDEFYELLGVTQADQTDRIIESPMMMQQQMMEQQVQEEPPRDEAIKERNQNSSKSFADDGDDDEEREAEKERERKKYFATERLKAFNKAPSRANKIQAIRALSRSGA